MFSTKRLKIIQECLQNSIAVSEAKITELNTSGGNESSELNELVKVLKSTLEDVNILLERASCHD